MSSLEEQLRQLQERVDHLESLEAIRKVLAIYCKAVDERDCPPLTPLWAHDAALLVRPWSLEFRGARAIMEFYCEYSKGPWIEPRHNYTNEWIQREGDGYTSFCYFHETPARDQHSVIGWSTWVDRFVSEDSAWKFARREIDVMALAPISSGWAGAAKIMDLS
jgi:hypothetical protein